MSLLLPLRGVVGSKLVAIATRHLGSGLINRGLIASLVGGRQGEPRVIRGGALIVSLSFKLTGAMMSKALDELTVSTHVERQDMAPSWDPNSHSVSTRVRLDTSQLAQRPDTIYNKPDRWGRRSMSPYWRRWMQIADPPFRYSTRARASGWFDYPSTASVGTSVITNTIPEWGYNFARLRPSGLMEVSCENAAKTRLLSKLSQKKWDLGVFAAEFSETVDLATSLSKDVAKAYRSIRPSNLSKNLSRLDKVAEDIRKHGLTNRDTDILNRFADRWMEYQFGIRPTLNDINDATTYLDSQIGQPLRAYLKSGAQREEEGDVDWPCVLNFDMRLTKRDTMSIHYALLYEQDTTGVSPLTSLGLDNPWSVGWEVIRLSWLVDYAIGIGDWLNSWTATNGVKLVQGCKSTIWRSSFERPRAVNLASHLEWIERPNPLINYRGGEFKRELLSSFPTPAIAPNFKQSVGGFQLANALFALKHFL